MQIHDAVKGVETHATFVSWKKEHPDVFFVHVFVLLDTPLSYQVGYFDPTEQKITSFQYDGSTVTALPPAEVFRKEDTQIKKLSLSDVTVTGDKALATANEFQQKEYSVHSPMKIFFILQHLAVGVVYNITFITQGFQTLNIKVDAKTGKVLTHSLDKLIDVVK